MHAAEGLAVSVLAGAMAFVLPSMAETPAGAPIGVFLKISLAAIVT